MNKHVLAIAAISLALSFNTAIAQQHSLKFPTSKPPKAELSIDPSASFEELIDYADLILAGTIENIDREVTDDIFAERYAVLGLSGTVATPSGPSNMSRKYMVRAPWTWGKEGFSGSEFIFFIRKNQKRYNPIVRALPVRDGIVYHHIHTSKPIVGFSISGDLLTENNYNKCDISEYHQYYNSLEPLDNVIRFTCKDGTPWVRGNDAPSGYQNEPLTVDNLILKVSDYYHDHNLPSPNLSSGFSRVVDKPIRNSAKLDDWSEYRDEIFRRLITAQGEASKRANSPEKDRRMIEFVQRELARGKSPENLPEKARGFVTIVKEKRTKRQKFKNRTNK